MTASHVIKRCAAGAGVAFLLAAGGATAAVAADYPPPTTPRVGPQVLGEQEQRGPAVASQVGSQNLPVTGGDFAAMAGVGVIAIGAGTVLVRRGRRQRG
jgi:hypothetical protein